MGTKQKTKIKAKAKGSNNTNVRVQRSTVASSADSVTVASELIARVRPTLPRLTDADLASYRSRFDDAQCDALGGETKSTNVVNLLTQWVPIIGSTLSTRPNDVAGYGPHRFAFLLESGGELIRTMHEQSAAESNKNRVADAKKLQRDVALSTRMLLIRKLRPIAGAHASDSAALDNAIGTTHSDTEIATSLNALASLASTWSRNPEHASLVRDASLTASDIAHATEAAASLIGASASRAEGGRRVAKDGPAVNRVEGRVLAELRVAFQVFRDSHAANRLVPALPLVPGTAKVFEKHHARPADATVGTPAGTPATTPG